jgi:ribosomal protein S6--L-glutamate ligase
MILSFHPCFTADRQIILADRALNDQDRSLILEAGFILLPQTCTQDLYEACSASSAHLFPNYAMRFRSPGKIGQCRLFRRLACPHPVSEIWSDVSEFQKDPTGGGYLARRFPFFIKADASHEGSGVFYVQDEPSLEHALQRLRILENSGHTGFLTQEAVASKGEVLRAVILGTGVITYWKRPGDGESFVTTVSRGAGIDRAWKPDLQEKGKKAAAWLAGNTGIDLAAVDFVFPLERSNPDPVFLEINYYFGRRGLGGSQRYYRLLYGAIRDWIESKGCDPNRVGLV